MSADLWPIKRLLEWTEKYFHEKAIDNPRLEAQILLSHVLRCKRIDLYVRSEEIPTEPERARFKELLKQRVEGCPVAYLTGQREFFQLTFEVDRNVLIPRPETEFVVLEALRLLKEKETPRILDIGTGSGCIALSIVHRHKTAQATAIDISAAALAVAAKNAAKHGLTERVRFVEGDLFNPVKGETFDLIASNPPYIAASEIPTLMKDVREFEPLLALNGGPDGLAVYRRLIAAAPEHLKPGGSLLLEIGATQESAVKELLEASGGFAGIITHRDGQKLPRVIEARRRANS